MGERARETDDEVREGTSDEEEKGRTERFDAQAPAGEGRPGEEHDDTEGQEEGVSFEKDAGTRTARIVYYINRKVSDFKDHNISRIQGDVLSPSIFVSLSTLKVDAQ